MNLYQHPIIVFGFNRPRNLERVLTALGAAGERQIYFFLDCPRDKNPNDIRQCAEVMGMAHEFASSRAGVKITVRTSNFGCRRNIEEGIDQVFKNHERAIILEDDCVPSPAFFNFCDLMLERFADDKGIGMITGGNFCNSGLQSADYFRTSYPLIWGWATWRRVWHSHDKLMSSFSFRNLVGAIGSRVTFRELLYWRHYFTEVKRQRIDTWDYQLTWTFFEKNYATIFPRINLVENIGFGSDATHTFHDSRNQAIQAFDWDFSPETLREDFSRGYDPEIFRRRFGGLGFWYLLKQELKRCI